MRVGQICEIEYELGYRIVYDKQLTGLKPKVVIALPIGVPGFYRATRL